MKFFTLSMYFFALLVLSLLAGVAVPVLGDTTPFISSADSQHTILFGGKNWGNVLKDKGKVLENAVIYDVMKQVNRKHPFNTTVTLHSISTKGLMLNISVHQAILPGTSDAQLQHLWSPEEVNSMIAQGKFNTTKGLYVGDDRPALISVQIPERQGSINVCTSSCRNIFLLVIIILIVMLFALIGLLIWVIYNCLCAKKDRVTKDRVQEDCVQEDCVQEDCVEEDCVEEEYIVGTGALEECRVQYPS